MKIIKYSGQFKKDFKKYQGLHFLRCSPFFYGYLVVLGNEVNFVARM